MKVVLRESKFRVSWNNLFLAKPSQCTINKSGGGGMEIPVRVAFCALKMLSKTTNSGEVLSGDSDDFMQSATRRVPMELFSRQLRLCRVAQHGRVARRSGVVVCKSVGFVKVARLQKEVGANTF